MEYYSAIKRNKTGASVEMWMDLETVIQNEVMSFATAWIDLETVTVRAISQTEKDKYHMIPLICGI